jgi:hypothetical protein
MKVKVCYTCKYCGYTNEITSVLKWFFTPHLGAKKWIRCEACNDRHFMKRQDGRKWLDWPTEKR